MKLLKLTARGAMALLLAMSLAIPARTQTATTAYAIKGGKVFTLAGPPIENGTVLIRDGKIAAVGANIAIAGDVQVIDATGLEVYPGMFDPITPDRSERSQRRKRHRRRQRTR